MYLEYLLQKSLFCNHLLFLLASSSSNFVCTCVLQTKEKTLDHVIVTGCCKAAVYLYRPMQLLEQFSSTLRNSCDTKFTLYNFFKRFLEERLERVMYVLLYVRQQKVDVRMRVKVVCFVSESLPRLFNGADGSDTPYPRRLLF